MSNDDGVSAPGIDALVQALRKVSGVTVKVVAPASNQSGAGGKTTAGAVSFTNTTTASGYPAVSVNGTPADAVNVAFSRLHLAPNVVISGVNAGQNLGPVVDISGTVGAARVGRPHGRAGSRGQLGRGQDFRLRRRPRVTPSSGWLRYARRLPKGPSSTPASVVSLNVPSCSKGQVRGELTLHAAAQAAGRPVHPRYLQLPVEAAPDHGGRGVHRWFRHARRGAAEPGFLARPAAHRYGGARAGLLPL